MMTLRIIIHHLDLLMMIEYCSVGCVIHAMSCLRKSYIDVIVIETIIQIRNRNICNCHHVYILYVQFIPLFTYLQIKYFVRYMYI